jgi:hypothetical protein
MDTLDCRTAGSRVRERHRTLYATELASAGTNVVVADIDENAAQRLPRDCRGERSLAG